jgi:HPt (histidine-containing phosphotransfer) domain-containing protein
MYYVNVQQIDKLRQFLSQEQLLVIINNFFDPVSSGKDSLSQSLNSHDVDSVLKNAHFIKGASSFMGMQGIYDFCIFIETELALKKDPPFEQLEQEFEAIWTGSKIEATNTYASN